MLLFEKSRYNFAAATIILAFVAFLVYANSLGGDFVCDDRPVILENPKIRSAEYLPDYFRQGLWNNTGLKAEDKYLYRPLLLVELYLAYQAWGANPFFFHLMNVLLHVLNSVLVFLLLRHLFKETPHTVVALLGALVFAVHPVHVEAVSWIVGQNDLLLTAAVVGGFLSYVRYRENNQIAYFAAAVVLSTIAMFLKEVAVAFPLLVLGYDHVKDNKINLRRAAVFLIPVLAFLLLRTTALGSPAGSLQPSWRNMGYLLEFAATYIKLLFVPWPLAFYFTRPPQGTIGIPGMVLSFIILLALILVSWKQKKLLFALWWIFITLLPPLAVAFHGKPHIMERVLYLPSVGFIIVLTGLMAAAFEKKRRITTAAVLVVVLIFSILTVQANKDWKNDEVFYAKAVRSNPEDGGAYVGLGTYYQRTGSFQKAADVYLQALPRVSGNELVSLHERLGELYGTNGIVEQSIFYYTKALEGSPDNSKALTGIGNNYLIQKQYQKALSFYLRAFSSDKTNYEASFNIALAYETLGNREKASEYYKLFIAAAPVFEYGDAIENAKNNLSRLQRKF